MDDIEKAALIARLREEFPYGAPEFMDITLDELELHSNKNHDYAGGGHPLGNFYRVSRLLGMYPGLNLSDPMIIALVYMLKQLDAVLWLKCQGSEAKVEGVDERLGDIHVYAKICRVIEQVAKKEAILSEQCPISMENPVEEFDTIPGDVITAVGDLVELLDEDGNWKN